ncbi:thioredoxin family protein [Paracoccus thiocyanatus]|uniref:thioredoxin family protein n=1 Tax=Paracoccus thiocyanatus TaxID=34006 RepID=UPI002161D9DA|nr:thioredoxin family protein [Paracoccus thiocyanatus]
MPGPWIAALLVLLAGSWGAAAAELRLLMFEQPGCIYCARWDAEIAPQYPLTDEGKAAPLRRLQFRDPVPAELELDRPVTFTPTFVLMDGNAEAGRLEGYPGEDFFWPLLARLIAGTKTAQ